jgi:hypothetical protein
MSLKVEGWDADGDGRMGGAEQAYTLSEEEPKSCLVFTVHGD